VSRLCDRVTRRAPPGFDTDLSGLGLGFIYPGNVRQAPGGSAERFDGRMFERIVMDLSLSASIISLERQSGAARP